MPSQIIDRLFRAISSSKPAWRTQFESEEHIKAAMAYWEKVLGEEGVDSMELLKRGLDELNRDPSPFLPSIGQFIQWCKGTDSQKFYKEFLKAINTSKDRLKWEDFSPRVYWIYCQIGSFNIRNADSIKIKQLFKNAYDESVIFEQSGGVFLPPSQLLEQTEPEFKEASVEDVESHLKKLKGLL